MKHFLTLSVVVKSSWILLAISVLFFTFHLYDGTPTTNDAELIMVYGMMTLSFPVSLILPLAIGFIGYSVEVFGGNLSIPFNHLIIVVEWLLLLGLGYLQWFVILPKLWHKLHKS